MRALSTLKRLTAPLLLALALAPLLASAPAQAQGNSREATEAARKYRAEKARGNAPAPQRANATTPPRAGSEAPRTDQAYRSSANPNADPKASLRSCLDHSGMNMAARDRCMRQHCEGRWGQGDCPRGGDLMPRSGSQANTPLGQCLREAGANPFKRDGCGWRHCRPRWESAECQALRPPQREPGT